MSSRRYMKEDELKNAVFVSNDVELKTEIGKHTRLIVSTDAEFYEKMIQRFPKIKHKAAKKSKKYGKALMAVGVGVAVLTGGVLLPVGAIVAGSGAVLEVAGLTMDDYRHYKMYFDYNNQRLIFKRTKNT